MAPKDAAESIGYSDPYPLLRRSSIQAAIKSELARVLSTEAAPVALSVLLTVAKDPSQSARVRVDASKILLDRAGFAPKPQGETTNHQKDLAAMTPDELHAFINKHEEELRRLERELSDRLQPVNETKAPPAGAKLADMLD